MASGSMGRRLDTTSRTRTGSSNVFTRRRASACIARRSSPPTAPPPAPAPAPPPSSPSSGNLASSSPAERAGARADSGPVSSCRMRLVRPPLPGRSVPLTPPPPPPLMVGTPGRLTRRKAPNPLLRAAEADDGNASGRAGVTTLTPAPAPPPAPPPSLRRLCRPSPSLARRHRPLPTLQSQPQRQPLHRSPIRRVRLRWRSSGSARECRGRACAECAHPRRRCQNGRAERTMGRRQSAVSDPLM
jgi:hypothetical protein